MRDTPTTHPPASPAGGALAGAVDVVLRDGETVHLRPLRADDKPALVALLDGLSERARLFRFFSAGMSMSRAAQLAVEQTTDGGHGLIAVDGSPEGIVAHGMFSPPRHGTAEVAFAVADAWQGRGLGTLLLAHLAAAARARGIDMFTSVVLPNNHRMIDVFRESGFPVRVRSGPDELLIDFPTEPTEQARRAFEDRDRVAAIAAVRHLLAPESIALLGASNRPSSVGTAVLANLRSTHGGRLFAVTRRARELDGLPVYGSIEEVGEAVDLAVIAVPASAVVEAARACGRSGVRTLLVISTGFEDDAGARRRQELVAVCRDFGMRLVGPNSLGVVSTTPGGELNTTSASAKPAPGATGLLTQSGGLMIAALEQGGARGIGLSAAVSIGDRADISSNDLLQWWEQDERTRVIALYLESFGNPRTFARVARRVARTKPIVAVKAGRSAAGAAAAASHTGALVAESDRTTNALFRHAGVIRTETFRELLDVTVLLESQPLPAGNRVAIVSNAGGAGVLCADACAAAGLRVPALAAATRAALAERLPPAAAVRNPVDMVGDAPPASFTDVLATVGADPAIDAIIAICAPTVALDVDAAVTAIGKAAGALSRPLPTVAVVLAQRPGVASTVPVLSFPEDAARALGRAAEYARWRRHRREPAQPPVGIDANAAAAILSSALGSGTEWLDASQVTSLARAYGLPLTTSLVVSDAEHAVFAQLGLGGPVAIKGCAPTLVGRTDAGAVRLGVEGEDAVRLAARDVIAAVSAAGHEPQGVVVQRMAPAGIELLVGVTEDPAFGAVVACAAGGVYGELLDDVAVRLAPLDAGDAEDMLRSLQLYPLLAGFRGAPCADVAALCDLIHRLAVMADAHPEVREIDANPVIASPDGATIVDLRVRVAPATPRPWAPSLQASAA